jgi:protoheme ferro-lyase
MSAWWWLCATGARSISFVSDQVETVHEIVIEHRAQARGLGIQDFRMVSGLSGSPRFIGALVGW